MAMSLCIELGARPDAGAGTPHASAGGKARSLRRLAELGWTVPRAFAVTAELYRAMRAGGPPLPRRLAGAADLAALDDARRAFLDAPFPAGFAAELDAQLDRIVEAGGAARPARFSVRSSFAREDHGDGVAAGVYLSRVGVARGEVAAAVREVLASALAPSAVAYAQARGEDPDDAGAAVLLHAYVAGDAAGSAAWDPSRAEPPVVEESAGALAADARAMIDGAVRALAAREGAIEVEWVADGPRVTFLQLRRYLAPPSARAWTGAAALDGHGGDGGGQGEVGWRWDAAHNPLPLSPAQAGLVALVDARCRIGIRQRVAGGYLFYAPDRARAGGAIEPASAGAALARLDAEARQRLAALGAAATLDEVLEIFVGAYEPLFGRIQPALRLRVERLAGFLAERLPGAEAALPTLLGGVASAASERSRRARWLARAPSDAARAAALDAYLARFGDEAPVWDVATPTYREDPSPLLAWLPPVAAAARDGAGGDGGDDAQDGGGGAAGAAARQAAAQLAARLDGGGRAAFTELLASAREAAGLGEDDDVLYAHLHAAVRAALARSGAALTRAGRLERADDVFWLPLDLVARAARGEAPPARDEAAALAAAARAAHRRALGDPPPGAAGTGAGAPEVRGQRASGGRAIGRAFVHRPGGALPPAPEEAPILVAATLLPTELPLLRAAGLIVETGGALGHVAAQARERGIPALVGAAGACAALADGDTVLLEADAGRAIVLARQPPSEDEEPA
jgi:pyruvate,water dikinase